MAHPHKGSARSSNVSKMRDMVGKGGSGSAFGAGSSFKRANKAGEQESFNGHSKSFEGGFAHGGKVKARGDRLARGGGTHGAKFKAGGGSKGKVMNETMPGHFAKGGSPKQAGGPTYMDPRATSGGHVPVEQRQPDRSQRYPGDYGEGGKRGGRFANGGRSKGKMKGDVNIMIAGGKPAVGGPGAGGLTPKPPGGPQVSPAAAGALGVGAPPPSMAPPPGGAPPGMGAPPGGAPPGGAPPMPPQAAQALQALAGGAGAGPMSGGLGGGKLPGMAKGGRAHKAGGGSNWREYEGNTPEETDPAWSGPPSGKNRGGRNYAKGGRTAGKMPGAEKHWAAYSDDNRPSKRGGTGESEELTLATPDKTGPINKADKRARGGGVGKFPDAGQATGVARLEQANKRR